ncbi:DNA cytosine methyltransferase [Desertihabitans brevis]|uniref:DNA (cytosine-5-)-methyltransferase n=1 Tax=Desertihabitans brevis TaxID=2268447 RepID=A0A367YQX8_9ACTN|nr:DNA cytosine methyltransferase [Desertihabitans brevis]RCK68293.1 DNA cytosine methyltransferase [Desertihabitans brevis]
MLTLTDIFAGAGGSSSGAAAVPGVQVVIAANHWRLAVDVHNLNHPATVHACVDLHMEDPRNFPRTDLLWASPECTKWSIANSRARQLSVAMGGDPTLFDDVPADLETSDQEEIDRSRLLMFDVLRFIEHHRYRAVVVENVVDIATQPKYASAWAAWRRGLRRLGYAFRVVSLNSMHAQAVGAPAPQSRDRLYVVAWPEREKAPDLDAYQRPKAWCSRCDVVVESRQAWKPGRTVGRYRAQYVYVCTACGQQVEPGWRPAADAIDWTLTGQRIGDRARPLSPKTMARIREGLRRYAHEFVLEAAGNTYDVHDPRHPRYGEPGGYSRAWPVTEPLRTLHTTSSKGLLIPTEGRDGKLAMSAGQPFRTQTTRNELGILTTLRGTNAPKTTRDTLDTVAASGNHHGLLVPSGGTWHTEAHPTGDPMRTVTTSENHGLLVPYYSASETGRPTSQPIGTLTTRDRYALIMRNNTPRGDAGQMTTPVTEPMRTLTAVGAGQSVLEPTTIDPEDCTFRMLEPHEIAAGMSFPLDYQWQGSKRDRVKLAGNAVTPPAARDLIAAVAASLLGEAA